MLNGGKSVDVPPRDEFVCVCVHVDACCVSVCLYDVPPRDEFVCVCM